ncbi:HET-domain-containing protein [Apiospora kogelbergensis]|uniref:HET-domain-containing protein n=1 Tax=Apiospora kogelbergensis TaxID=1337665 RepID=UPI00312E592E
MACNESFEYVPLDLSRPALRLLHLKAARNVTTLKRKRLLLEGENPPVTEKESAIECELIESFFDTDLVPDYEAVSYTWGSADDPREICLEGSAFLVTHNLWSLLLDIRYLHQDRILWIDAICIDQGNHSERGHQVQQMSQIYHNAQRVILWLGPLTNPISILMDSLADLQQQMRGLNWTPDDPRWQIIKERTHGDTLRCALMDLLERPWFRRVWIIQEVANARAAIVHCGFKSVSSRILTACPSMLHVAASSQCQAILDIMPGPSRRDSWWSRGRDLNTLLIRFSDTKATREHDKIFALLGLCPEANAKISVDYNKPVPQLIRETLSFIYNCAIVSLPTINSVESLLATLATGGMHNIILEHKLRYSDTASVERFLLAHETQLFLTPDVCYAAAEREPHSEEILKSIFSLKEEDFQPLDDDGITISLLRLISCGNVTAVRLFLDQHPTHNINSQYTKLYTPISHASELGYEGMVKLLLDRGAKQSYGDIKGATPLVAASRNGHEGVVKLLLDQDIRDRFTIECEVAAIIAAANNRHLKIVRLLLEQGAELGKCSDAINKMLFAVPCLRRKDVVQLLLDHGAKGDCVDSCGNTPVIKASEIGYADTVRVLLDSGVNHGHRNYDGYTALMYSSRMGHKDIVQLLLERGANCETRNAQDENALLLAAVCGNDDVVQVLLDHGANCNTWHRSWDGNFESPVSVAMKLGHQHVVKRLLDEGAKLPCANDDTSDSELSSTSDSEELEQPNDGSEGD